MARKQPIPGRDPVIDATDDGTYSELLTPLNAVKADPDPQAQLQNDLIPYSTGQDAHDPLGILDLTGERDRRGDPNMRHGTMGQSGIKGRRK